MAKKQMQHSFMERISATIVDKRGLIFLIYGIALIFSFFSIGWVKTENDITTYLSKDTETRQGVVAMNENFVSFGTGRPESSVFCL